MNLANEILTKNYFKFDNVFYLQKQGVSMGSPFSPNYANLFMGKFEEDFVYTNNPFSPSLKCWFRYIDDIFFIFNGTIDMLNGFKSYINSRLPSIKFTLEASLEKISFLDVCVKKTSNGIQTSVYRKETDRNNYLHHSSYHSSSLKKRVTL